MVDRHHVNDSLGLANGAISNYRGGMNLGRKGSKVSVETPNKLAATRVYRKAGMQPHRSGKGEEKKLCRKQIVGILLANIYISREETPKVHRSVKLFDAHSGRAASVTLLSIVWHRVTEL